MTRHEVSHPAATDGDDPLVGTVVADRYRIVRRLGEGGMGTVYEALHEALRKPVALKVLAGRYSSDKAVVARFEREAIAAANLRHPNIVEATDFGRLSDGTFYLVMEYVEGVTLRALLRASPAGLAHARALWILQQVAAALARAHAAGIVHRDLKPENVIVFDRRDVTDAVKVIDFGIARIRDAFGVGGTALTAVGSVFGTPEYMAPEQVLGKTADARADQYAFGALAFEILTGQVPFTGLDMSQILMKHVSSPIPSASDVAPHVPDAVSAVLGRLLAKRPEDRFASIGDAVQALESAFTAPSTGGTPGSATLRMGSLVSGPSGAAPPGTTVSLRGRGADETPPPAPAHPATPMSARTGDVYAAPRPTRLDETAREVFQDLKSWFLDAGSKRQNPILLFGLLAAGALTVLLVVALIVRGIAASSLPDDVDDALDHWEDGDYEKAEPALRAGLEKRPALATEPAVYRPLVDAVHEERARSALLRLLKTTALGRSAPMAAQLADIGLQDASPIRNGALRLLRGRLDLLPREQRARIALRDADDCASLQEAVGDLSGAGSDAEDDARRYREGECRKLVRRDELCGCPPPGSFRGRGKKGGGR